MTRRELLAGSVGVLSSSIAAHGAIALPDRVRPGTAGWPNQSDWSALSLAVGGRLERIQMPALDPALASNPFYLGNNPTLTQSSGWVDAWRSQPSAYVVVAESAADVAAAVRFAVKQRVRLVVKGGGHSYLGGSNAPDSLLLWTRRMDAIALHDAFVPSRSLATPVPAVSVGSGCIWLHVYGEVTTKAGRYVQGGGCTTVGVAGLVQGGGFGSFSKKFGLDAASLLEAEIVTADGQTRLVNQSREPDLFWAIKGGGGGTFGIVTRMTLRTHDLPQTFGAVLWGIKAASDTDFRHLIDRFLAHYVQEFFNPHWGEQVRATPQNVLSVQMIFQGVDAEGARRAWSELEKFVKDHAAQYKIVQPLTVLAFPAQRMWDYSFLQQQLPSAIATDTRPDAKQGDYWWAGNTGEAGTFWHGYSSVWLPASLLQPAQREHLTEAWFEASRHWSVTLHFNKGLAGGSAEAIARSRETSMNPQVLDAFALAIIGSDGPRAFPGLPAPDLVAARKDATAIATAARTFRKLVPESGCYVSESDYFLNDWQQEYWGEHWHRLSEIKRRYDPNGLFVVHHGIGSERWSSDGFQRIA